MKKKNILTLEKLGEAYDQVRDIDQTKCETCGKKAAEYYFVEGRYVGNACEQHKIKENL